MAKGIEKIISYRNKGKKVTFITINDEINGNASDWDIYKEIPSVDISSKDKIEHIDFRFVATSVVSIIGFNDKRIEMIFHSCVDNKAKEVYANTSTKILVYK